jgi:MinD-like ATPase involved in chromosome partitioning or flagellar assembly
MYLSRFKKNVCILDFDLEAPGLHKKFEGYLDSEVNKGLVDYIYEFIDSGDLPESLENYCVKLKVPNGYGGITLIPAGKISLEYWKKLVSINWYDLFFKDDEKLECPLGVPLFCYLKEQIEKEIKPDFLLIDSRTGVTETSSLCISILSDVVVCFMGTNKENQEGIKQILLSLKRTKELQERPFKVIIAITRIPKPENETEDELERKIVKDILDYLNEPYEGHSLEISKNDIYVLHSYRDLEKQERLLIESDKIRESILTDNYMQLFSNLLPKDTFESEIDKILGEIVDWKNMLSDPEKTQKDIEMLARNYPYKRSYEYLINYYILRRKYDEDLLNAFHKLWNIGGFDDNEDMLTKYVNFFKGEYPTNHYDLILFNDDMKFNPKIIEEYLKKYNNDIDAMGKLAELYRADKKYDKAVRYYYKTIKYLDELIKNPGEQSNIKKIKDDIYEYTEEFLDMLYNIDGHDYELKILDELSTIIDKSYNLKTKKMKLLYKYGNYDEIEKMINEDENFEMYMLKNNPRWYRNIMKLLGLDEKISMKLDEMLYYAVESKNISNIVEVGEIYYELGKRAEFKEQISKYSFSKYVLERLDKYKRRNYI